MPRGSASRDPREAEPPDLHYQAEPGNESSSQCGLKSADSGSQAVPGNPCPEALPRETHGRQSLRICITRQSLVTSHIDSFLVSGSQAVPGNPWPEALPRETHGRQSLLICITRQSLVTSQKPVCSADFSPQITCYLTQFPCVFSLMFVCEFSVVGLFLLLAKWHFPSIRTSHLKQVFAAIQVH